jgi:hypothetical protein
MRTERPTGKRLVVTAIQYVEREQGYILTLTEQEPRYRIG